MKDKVNDFVDLFRGFHSRDQTEQIVLLVYFHAIEEGRESVSKSQLEHHFRLADLPVPKNLGQLLTYLSGKGQKLINSHGEFSLRREVRRAIDEEVRSLRGVAAPPKVDGGSPFHFEGRTFSDEKVRNLLGELRKCYPLECWNACGLLIRIIVERTLDSVDPTIKAKTGLRDKINGCRNLLSLSKSLREALDGLHGTKIMGDVAAHHSKILLHKPDVDLILPAFRVLMKEVTNV